MRKIPRTFCVTLKETPIRTRLFNESAAKSGIIAEPFYGVFGQNFGLVPKYPNEIECPDQNIFMTDGAVGCYLSHFVLWNVLSYLPEDEFLIVEDDAIFVDGFQEKFNACYDRLPQNWDLVYVGWLPCGDTPVPVVVDEGISIRHPSATHAYMIKKRVLQTAIEAIQPCGSPIDLVIARRLLPTIKFYTFDPPLVTQKSYLNSTDSTWTSLVYDWKNDLYGCKKKLIADLEFVTGWYQAERNNKEAWKWSRPSFTLKIPAGLDFLDILCSTPIENVVTINGEQHSLKLGDNTIRVTPTGTEVNGTLGIPFIPSKQTPNSSDTRELGLCLKRLYFHMGETVVPVEVTDKVTVIPPMTLKL